MTQPAAPQSLWHRLLTARLSRRSAVASMAAGAVALPVQLTGFTDSAARAASGPAPLAPPFAPIQPAVRDELVLPLDYRADPLVFYGDPLNATDQFGYNADYTAFLRIDALDAQSSQGTSTDGLLVVNHEYPHPVLQHGRTDAVRDADSLRIERASLGLSILRVQLADGRWRRVDDPLNRRVTGYTVCRFTGPAAGSEALLGAYEAEGSVGNCSGGVTPWHTVLSCEENVDDYAVAYAGDGKSWGWHKDATYVKQHQGWVLEVDPFDPAAAPRKHTALGRFRHENVAVWHADGEPIVAYMGDDKRDSCVFKFVSTGRHRAGDRAANMALLESGQLYAADFLNGRWLLLDYDRQEALRTAKGESEQLLFHSQADVLADARAAALALKATPVDRPEDLEIHPHDGSVYIALTNNDAHGNFHGQIVRLEELAGAAGDRFAWELFAVGGPQSGFSSPDNLVFDAHGNLWMVTDISSRYVGKDEYPTFRFQGNNALFFIPTDGPDRGRAFQFASGPVQCELTGPCWTPDGRTLFLSVQHPGEETTDRDRPTSRWPGNQWPDAYPGKLPLPGVVAIQGFPGWA
jgi:secreted PhoX family phosphatase